MKIRTVGLTSVLAMAAALPALLALGVISVAVVAAYVNAGGLGAIILAGIQTDHAPKIWAGALTACALAVATDLGLAQLERDLGHVRLGGQLERVGPLAQRVVAQVAGDVELAAGHANHDHAAGRQRDSPCGAIAQHAVGRSRRREADTRFPGRG